MTCGVFLERTFQQGHCNIHAADYLVIRASVRRPRYLSPADFRYCKFDARDRPYNVLVTGTSNGFTRSSQYHYLHSPLHSWQLTFILQTCATSTTRRARIRCNPVDASSERRFALDPSPERSNHLTGLDNVNGLQSEVGAPKLALGASIYLDSPVTLLCSVTRVCSALNVLANVPLRQAV